MEKLGVKEWVLGMTRITEGREILMTFKREFASIDERVSSLKSLCEWVAVNSGKICGGQDLQGRGKFLSVTSALSEGWAFVNVSWTSVMMWAQNKKEDGF